jgi:tripartite-type tricarboxylate transporter receptor subunit TctC
MFRYGTRVVQLFPAYGEQSRERCSCNASQPYGTAHTAPVSAAKTLCMKQVLSITFAVSMLTTPCGAFAQASYPEKPVRIVVGFVPGSGADIVARVVGQKLSEYWGQPVIVENLPGAVGNLGAARVSKSAPDGYTLLSTGDAAMTTNVTLFGKQLPYDPVRDFAPIILVALSTNVLVVHPSVPARNIKELVALAKAHPGKLSYASGGSGSSQHLGGELLKKRASIDMVHIPYKGAPLAMQDVMAGRVDMTFGNITQTLPQVRSGKLRAIAVSTLTRWPLVPDVPTVAESGYPGFEAVAWYGLLAPGNTPNAVVQKLYQDMLKALAVPEVRTRLTDTGLEVVGRSPQEFAVQIKDEIVKKGQLIKDSGAKRD